MSYRVCIPTAGTGSRLNDATKYINKSLVGVANRPVLTHLVDQFPDDAEFVLALGYKGSLVREFVEHAYPNRVFHFAEVSPYEGSGSGLGLSLLKCKTFLQEPFVFCSCDTLVDEKVPAPDHNWMGFAEVDDASQYRTIKLLDTEVQDVCEKGVKSPDLKAYIGLAGVQDYEMFWNCMQSGEEQGINAGEVYGLRSLLQASQVSGYAFSWMDTGNPEALAKAREKKKEDKAPNILDKANESIWFVGDRVIKFSADQGFIANRVKRASEISEFTPEITLSTRNMYQYAMVSGDVLSDVISIPLFGKLLEASEMFWKQAELLPHELTEFNAGCLKFYKDKTEERVELFYRNFDQTDGREIINGQAMPLLSELLDSIDWQWLSSGLPGRFHGDFHFENILWSEKTNKFTFLDWRQDFAGSIKVGDVYYDLAKLLHGMIVSHGLIAKDLFSVNWEQNQIKYDLNRKQILVDCEREFKHWLESKGYDVKKVWTLTALIYLNIAALHHFPYSLLLYSLGKDMLYKIITGETVSGAY